MLRSPWTSAGTPRGEIADDPSRVLHEHRVGARHVALDRSADDDTSARNGAENDRVGADRDVTADPDVSLDAPEDLERRVAPNVAADDRGACND